MTARPLQFPTSFLSFLPHQDDHHNDHHKDDDDHDGDHKYHDDDHKHDDDDHDDEQERFQSRGITPQYRVVQAEGASHAPTFSFQVALSSQKNIMTKISSSSSSC